MMTDLAGTHTLANSTLSEEDIKFIKRIASKIVKSGLVTPAVFFLEMSKPLALLGSHAAIFFGPVLNAFIQSDGYYKAVQIFEEPDNVEILIRELESLEANKHAVSEKEADEKKEI